MSRHGDIATRMDEFWDRQEREEQAFQATLASDPAYLEWLDRLELQKQQAAQQAIDDTNTGTQP